MPLKIKKKKHALPKVDVNVTSLMDILTTLLFFILMVLSFNKLSILEAFAPRSGSDSTDEKIFSLKIVLSAPGQIEINLGPTTGLKLVNEDAFEAFLDKEFKGNTQTGAKKVISHSDPKMRLALMQDTLIGIKRAFPHEMKVTLALTDKVDYQEMISTMESLKQLSAGKAPMDLVNLLGKAERSTVLFPQVVVAEH